MTVKIRIAIEKEIVTSLIKAALGKGYVCSVNDGETTTLKYSNNLETILQYMFTTDEDILHFHDAGKLDEGTLLPRGFVHLVYGNEGWDVISNYTLSLEELMVEPNKISDKYAA